MKAYLKITQILDLLIKKIGRNDTEKDRDKRYDIKYGYLDKIKMHVFMIKDE